MEINSVIIVLSLSVVWPVYVYVLHEGCCFLTHIICAPIYFQLGSTDCTISPVTELKTFARLGGKCPVRRFYFAALIPVLILLLLQLRVFVCLFHHQIYIQTYMYAGYQVMEGAYVRHPHQEICCFISSEPAGAHCKQILFRNAPGSEASTEKAAIRNRGYAARRRKLYCKFA